MLSPEDGKRCCEHNVPFRTIVAGEAVKERYVTEGWEHAWTVQCVLASVKGHVPLDECPRVGKCTWPAGADSCLMILSHKQHQAGNNHAVK